MSQYTQSKRDRLGYAKKPRHRVVRTPVYRYWAVRTNRASAGTDATTALARAQNVEFISLNEKSHLKVDLNCCLCNVHMTNIHETHNPYPLRPDTEDSRCCAKCNAEIVIPARLDAFASKMK